MKRAQRAERGGRVNETERKKEQLKGNRIRQKKGQMVKERTCKSIKITLCSYFLKRFFFGIH